MVLSTLTVMFKITIDDVFTVREKSLVSGKCENRNEFSSRLIDDDGTEYTAFIPFIKYIVMPEYDYITLELQNVHNPNALNGRTLKTAVCIMCLVIWSPGHGHRLPQNKDTVPRLRLASPQGL